MTFEVPVYPDEEDGFTNHKARLSVPPVDTDKAPRAVVNRVVVIAPTVEKVKELQALLPEWFHEFEPRSYDDLVMLNERPEPNRLVWITPAEIEVIKESRRGRQFFLAYSIFSYYDSYGHWVDLRDGYEHSKWGRSPVRHAPGKTLSEQIFRGETTIAEVKAKCGFK